MAFLFVFFFWDSYDLNVGAFNIVPEVSEGVLISFNYFFLSVSFISTILSYTSLILQSIPKWARKYPIKGGYQQYKIRHMNTHGLCDCIYPLSKLRGYPGLGILASSISAGYSLTSKVIHVQVPHVF